MLRNMKLQASILIAIGASLGYAASGQLRLNWFARAADSAKAPVVDKSSAATCSGCCSTGVSRDALVARTAHNEAATDETAANDKKPTGSHQHKFTTEQPQRMTTFPADDSWRPPRR
jgi:hypothetical protein